MDPYTALLQASLDGDVPRLVRALSQDPLLLGRFPIPGAVHQTPMHVAALGGHVEFVGELLNRQPDMAQLRNGEGLLPIHLAAARGHVGVVKRMLEFDQYLCVIGDRDGRTFLHVAAACNRVAMLQEFMDVSGGFFHAIAVTAFGETILHISVKHDQFEAVRFVAERHRELVHVKDYSGNTALHYAAARRNAQTVNYLLKETSIYVNEENHNGCTALDMALETSNGTTDSEFCKMLRYLGARNGRGGRKQLPAADQKPCAAGEGGESNKTTSTEGVAEVQNAIMVVATVIIGGTYQTGLQESAKGHHPMFRIFNTLALACAMVLVILPASGLKPKRLIATRSLLMLLTASLAFMGLAFGFGTIYKEHDDGTKQLGKLPRAFIFCTVLLVVLLYCYHFITLSNHFKRFQDKRMTTFRGDGAAQTNTELELPRTESPSRPLVPSTCVTN